MEQDGYSMGNDIIWILCYTDDVMLFTESKDDLQKLLHRLTTTVSIFNTNIFHQKATYYHDNS